MIALLLAAAPIQEEVIENLEQQEELVLVEDSETEELAVNEECEEEVQGEIVFDSEGEASDLVACEDEE